MKISNVRIIDANKDFKGSIVIEEGIVKEVLENQVLEGEGVLDGKGMCLMPSFVDMHAHMREPGFEYKENLETGLSAALRGGFTQICAMANTNPVMDSFEKIKKNLEKARKLELADMIQVSAVTRDFEDESGKTVDFERIRELTPIFSNDGKNMANMKAMEEALTKSAQLDFVLSCHCEPETEMTDKYIEAAGRWGGNIHICHISKKETLEAIIKGKNKGLSLTCEVTPHHIFGWENPYPVAPPLAAKEDVDALIMGIKDGYIDVCATDHAPHTAEDKKNGMPGISNIEYAFSVYHTVFEGNGISINRLSEMMSEKPAKILGLNTGTIDPGKEANLVLADLDREYVIDTNEFLSKGKNTPFEGCKVKGKIEMTIKRGVVKYDNGQIIR
ncbi:dihydroorotase [Alkalibacter mobilis]|uniref:dihydroorotase n=1 Tax=Alkalibacter mobilis TaxID=2787712 RepID=UPI00189F8EAF|nr:dihydroorotase [Alkalibacter mobilis]MBF7096678.1 dihydroorotase [Alkalibacter mobilis]